MAIPGQANINIGAENQVAGSDTLFAAFHTIQDNFDKLFETSSPFDTFRAGDGVTVASNVSNGVVSITNTGVTKITAGSGVAVSGANGNVTISVIPEGPVGVTSVGLTSTSLNVGGVTGNIVSAGTFTVDLPRLPTGENFATGEYIAPTLTVDSFGRITSIANGLGVGTVTSVGLNPGKGISVTGGPILDSGSITVENTGVTSVQAGRGIQVTSANGDITISASNEGSGSVAYVDVTSNNLTVTGGPITSIGTITVDLPESFISNLYSNAVAANYIPTYTGNLTPSNIDASGDITGNNITATNVLHANVVSANTFTGTFSGNATTAGTVTTNAQPNITSVGTLSSVTTTGNADVGGGLNVTGNVIVTGNTNAYIATSVYGAVQSGFEIGSDGYILFRALSGSGNYVAFVPPTNVDTAGLSWQLPNTIGNARQVLVSDGGELFWRTPPAAGSNSQIQFNDVGNANGSTNLTFNKTTGTLGAGNIIVTGNTTSVNVFASTQMTAQRFISNIATGTAPFTVTSTTQVANLNAALAGTVVTAAQPNITSTGTLTGLTVSGNATFSGAVVTLGAVANLRISGGTSGQYLRTDGAGNLTWATVAGGSSYADSNVDTLISSIGSITITTTGNISGGKLVTKGIRYANGRVFGLSFEGSTANIGGLHVFSDSTNIGGNLSVSGKSTLGDVGNINIGGGSSGQVLSTDGAGNLAWISVSGGGGSSFDASQQLTITNTDESTSITTGAVRIAGGLAVVGNVNSGGNLKSTITESSSTGNVVYSKYQSAFTNKAGDWMQSGLYFDGTDLIINQKYWKDPIGFAQVKSSITNGTQFTVDPGGYGGINVSAMGDWTEQTMYGTGIWTISMIGSSLPPAGELAVIAINDVTLVAGGVTNSPLVTGQVLKTNLNGQLITNRISSHDADVTISTYDIMFNTYHKIYLGGFGSAAISLDDTMRMDSQGIIQRTNGNITIMPNIMSADDMIIMSPGTVSAKYTVTKDTTFSGLGGPLVAGQRSFITDSDKVAEGNFGTIAGGGGANSVPVYYDGTTWRIG